MNYLNYVLFIMSSWFYRYVFISTIPVHDLLQWSLFLFLLQILESSQSLLHVLKREAGNLKERSRTDPQTSTARTGPSFHNAQ